MQRIKEVMMMEEPNFVFPILGHPTMWPNTSFVDLVSSFWLPSLVDPLTSLFDSESWGLQVGFFFLSDLHHAIARACDREGGEPRCGREEEEEEG
jgi:hypothetical protein